MGERERGRSKRRKSFRERGRGGVCEERGRKVRTVRSWQLDEREDGHRGQGRSLSFYGVGRGGNDSTHVVEIGSPTESVIAR